MASTAKNFKGDASELKMRASAEPAFDLTGQALDQFYESGAESSAFLLMLYDEGRMPFSNRINREVFVTFIKQALANYPSTGTFEAYLFVLREVFGAESDFLFEVPAPGKLNISVNAVSDIVFGFLVREYSDGILSTFTLTTSDDEELLFRGLSGIENEHQFNLLFSEIMPAGIFPTLSLEFFSKSDFIGEDDDGIFGIITYADDSIIFVETGE